MWAERVGKQRVTDEDVIIALFDKSYVITVWAR